ncbi:MAG: OmpA family protein [Taibaiella sp.]|nr:OmpA family protein [Taibaiella sp.]
MIRKLGLSVIAVLCIGNIYAQRYMGIATGNWAPTNSIYLNPANIADSRDRFVIDLASVNFGVDNNFASLNTNSAIRSFFRGDSVNINNIFNYNSRQRFDLMAPYAEVRLPGFMYSINHNHSIALTTRVRVFNQYHNFSQSLYQSIAGQDYNNNTGDYTLNANSFNWTAHLWSEIGLSYAGVIFNNGQHFLKGGFTVRYLAGAAYINMTSKNLDVNYTRANDQLKITNTDVKFTSNIINSQNSLQNGIGNLDIIKSFFGSNGGKGIGGDAGLVYEWRPHYQRYVYEMDGRKHKDYTKNMYKLRLSVAVTDIGAITYNTNNFAAHFTGNGTLIASQIKDSVKDYKSFVGYAQRHGFNGDSGAATTKVYLPTAIVASVDYKVYRHVYANVTYIGNVANRDNVGNTYYSQVTLTPRFDTRVFSVGVPITYSTLTEGVKIGTGIRLGGFFIGSDDMLAFFSNSQYGVNFYLGGFVPIARKHRRDRDHDGVSDKKDLCPDVPGPWENKGCPDFDRDKDGIPDSLDDCPDLPGSITANGCPDKDLDSVADDVDKCPDVPGLRSLNGCPDTDGDGIADIEDACPYKPGPAIYHGCPDTDGDGVPDNLDMCPDVPGPIALRGCPDRDGDGVPDREDNCPTVPGPASNHGCPLIKEEVKKRLAFAATAIQFETGKAVIKKASHKILNEIVQILRDYPDYNMAIAGHTDNVGKPAKNLLLSQQRAASVKNYFVSQGIKMERLTTSGYGETRPVATNKTAVGRAKNRRVVMDMQLKN